MTWVTLFLFWIQDVFCTPAPSTSQITIFGTIFWGKGTMLRCAVDWPIRLPPSVERNTCCMCPLDWFWSAARWAYSASSSSHWYTHRGVCSQLQWTHGVFLAIYIWRGHTVPVVCKRAVTVCVHAEVCVRTCACACACTCACACACVCVCVCV